MIELSLKQIFFDVKSLLDWAQSYTGILAEPDKNKNKKNHQELSFFS